MTHKTGSPISSMLSSGRSGRSLQLHGRIRGSSGKLRVAYQRQAEASLLKIFTWPLLQPTNTVFSQTCVVVDVTMW